MSDQPEKLGGGLMFKNRRKNKPNHPDYTGNDLKLCCPKCREEFQLAIAAWEKKGGGFYSIALSEPRSQDNGLPREDAPKSEAPSTNETPNVPPPDDDIPF